MVNGVNHQNYINPYQQTTVKKTKADQDAPAFLLNYDEDGVVWDRNDSDKKTQKEKPKTVPSSVVRIKEIDSDTVQADSAITKKTVTESTGSGIISGIKAFFTKIFQFIWYGNDTKEVNTEEVSTKEDSTLQKETLTVGERNDEIEEGEKDKLSDEEKIAELLKKKDTDGIMEVLTKNHTILPARSTTLLTCYDRRGRIVNLNQTNTERILHGDYRKKSYRDMI